MICTDDEELASSLIMSRAHGWDRQLNDKKSQALRQELNINDFYSKYTFYDLAFNIRPTEINGFIGNIQLKYLDEIVSKRFNNFLEISNFFRDNDHLIEIDFDHIEIVSSFAIPIITKSKDLQMKYIKKFQDAKIEVVQ